MTFDSRGWVSIVELVVFIPSLIVSLIICSRHGFNRSSGWIYTLILCIVRIAGAISQLLTYHDTSTSLLKTTLIIDSIGLSPLLLATLGMLSRLVDWINARAQGMLTIKHFRLLQLVISIGLILSIAGGSSGDTQSNGASTVSTTSKAAIALFIVGYIGICLIWLVSMPQVSIAPGNEKRISLGVMLALPFIFVRLLYSALAVFVHNSTFNIIDGSVGVHVAMAVIEEFIVVFIYLFLGFILQPLRDDEQGPIASRAWKEKKSRSHRSSSESRRSGSHHRSHSRRNSGNLGHTHGVVYPPQQVHYQTAHPHQAPGMRPGEGYGEV